MIVGLQYTSENHNFDAPVQNKNGGVNNLIIDYRVSYLKIPVGIRLYPGHFGAGKNRAGGFFMQLNYSTDLLTKENITTTTVNWGDPHFSHGGTYSADVKESVSYKIRYHHISPSFMMGGSIGEKHLSFTFATQLQFFGVFQPHITQEYFKNAQLGMVLGINYRF